MEYMDYKLKCNVNFQSKWAFFPENNICFHVDEFTNHINNFTNSNGPVCKNGHQLVYVNGKKRKRHFRHKHSEDVGGSPMTQWHCEWQGNFPITEVLFQKNNETQVKSRRADALIDEYGIILEFQHSSIDETEVNNRKNDYWLHNKEIIWIIDGNSGISVNMLDHSNRIYLEFISEPWKYQSFMSYDHIYIDIANQIYKVYMNNIKSSMTDVEPSKTKQEFIYALNNGIDLWSSDAPSQCKLYIKQQGAGNGKTYGIIQMLASTEFQHYKSIILVTKQHSAKYIIYKEFTDQLDSGDITNLKIEGSPNVVWGKYIIKYHNVNANVDCQIIIATIDSFMNAIGNKNHTDLNMFEGLVNSIIDEHIECNDMRGTINYGGLNPKLNKETCLVIDEFQDLPQYYAKAVIQIMRNRYIDAYVVGDTMQSISFEQNSFTFLLEEEVPNITKIVYPFSNICRRFTDPKLVDFVNNMISFDKYNLPLITPYKNDDNISESLIIFEGNCIYSNTIDNNMLILNKEVENFMKHYEKEVEENNRVASDFLIVTLFTQNNPLVSAIEIAINMYWNNKDKKEDYFRYAVFHKSELGTSINLSESEHSTRIVSIHSSKGDGRNVVFVIGLDENSLKRFSGRVDSLIYESLFHVAITRMKEKLYIRLDINNKNDNIHTKIRNYCFHNNIENSDITPSLNIYDNVKYTDLVESCKTNKIYESFSENIINSINLKNLQKNVNDKQLIDMGHHNIRYAALFITLILEIVNKDNINQDNTIKKQIKAMLFDVSKSNIITVSHWKEYNIFLDNNCNLNRNQMNKKQKKEHEDCCKSIPILKLSNQGRDYRNHYNSINIFINKIQEKLLIYLNNNKILPVLCPFECVILYFMLEVCSKGTYTNIHINEIYNITDIYSKYFNDSLGNHTECLCKSCFANIPYDIVKSQSGKATESDEHIQETECRMNIEYNSNSMQKYIFSHYEKMIKIQEIYNMVYLKYPKINWLMNSNITFGGTNNNFNVYKRFSLIGYNEKDVIIAYINPQFNSLNYNEIIMNSIFDTFFISNIKKESENKSENQNYERFNGRNITTIIFTTDMDEPYYINWVNNNGCLLYTSPSPRDRQKSRMPSSA